MRIIDFVLFPAWLGAWSLLVVVPYLTGQFVLGTMPGEVAWGVRWILAPILKILLGGILDVVGFMLVWTLLTLFFGVVGSYVEFRNGLVNGVGGNAENQ